MSPVNASLGALNGVHFFHPLGYSGNSELMVRGGEANYTKVRIEGIEVNNAMDSRGAGFSFASLAGMPLTHFQLAKGARSSIEGSGALNGVLGINLGTDTPLSYVGGRFGSTGLSEFRALTGQQWGSGDSQVGVYDLREDDRFRGHRFEGRGAFLRARYQTDPAGALSASVWSTSSKQVRLPEDSGGLQFAQSDALEQVETDTTGVSVRYQQRMAQPASLSVTLGHYAIDTLTDSPGVPGGERNPMGIPANRFDDAFRRFQAEADLRWSVSERLELVLGTAFQRERAQSDSVVHLFPGFSLPSAYEESRDTHSLFAELGYEWIEGSVLQLSQRMENVSGLEVEWSTGATMGRRSERLGGRFYLSFHEAFKAPSLFALNNDLVGNRELDPERSDTWELGVTGSFRAGQIGWHAALFRQTFSNMVDLSELSQRLENLSALTVDGAEFSVWVDLDPVWRGSVDVSVFSVDFDVPGEVLRHRPEQRILAELQWRPRTGHRMVLGYQWTGRRWDSSIPTGNRRLKADSELLLSWDWSITPSVELTVELQNLLNQRLDVLIGYAKPQTSGSVSLTWTWDA